MLFLAALVCACAAGVARAGGGRVACIEPVFFNDSVSLSAVVALAGARARAPAPALSALSLMAWPGAYAPSAASPLPPVDAAVASALRAARAAAPGLAVWGGVSLCPGPAYACMLDANASEAAGAAVAAAAAAAGLDGLQLSVSPYCNNADCKRTTGRYAQGIARLVAAIARAAPGLAVALLLNEWDHVEIVAAARPTALFSYQTIFYFTSVADCQRDAGALCGAGESVANMRKAGVNFSATLDYLAEHRIAWLGQMHGATTPEADNPPDFWPALQAFIAPAVPAPAALDAPAPAAAAAAPAAPARALILWLYSPTATAATWASWYGALAAHAGNVTGVAPCSYLMNDAGAFVSQMNASGAALAW